ncbi:MAG: creatininase family protein [Anaerolineaceae bacterium]|nr:creatininase family protein [Anaerolineaceae bacterium]
MEKEIWLEYLTWMEIKAAIAGGFDTVLLIAGSIEQHGPHLPISTDTVLGYELAERTARKMGKTLVAPVVRPGMSEHHMAFPGTITLSKETFMATVSEYVHSLARHGFRRIAVTYSHGGNAAALAELLPRLAAELPDTEILSIPGNDAFGKAIQHIAEADGIDQQTMGVHAGEFETSAMLAYDDAQVRSEKLSAGYKADFSKDKEKLAKHLQDGLHTITDNGVLGDARPADKARGERYLDAVTDYISKSFIRVEAK